MKQFSIYLTSSLMLLSLAVGIAVGYFVTPEYQETMFEDEKMGLGDPDRWLDQRYLDSMISHHRAAILLADQASQQSQRTEISNLAKDILQNEPKLIDELYNWKSEWYGNKRQVTDPQIVNLGSWDKNYDLRFLNALIAHHEAGIEMTKEVSTKSSRVEVIENAQSVENFLKTTLLQLKSWRLEWYQV